MAPEHTPGEWEWGYDRTWLFHHDRANMSSSTILKIDDDPFAPSADDAALIAAAPTLLAEHATQAVDLEMLLAAIESDDPKAELLIRVKDAISRAHRAVAEAAA